MKALIPAAGLGTRFLPLTRVVPKEMLPIGSRPAMELLVEEARRAGAEEIVIIISHAKELIREYFRGQDDVSFVYQEEQKGLGHAVLQAREAVLKARGKVKGEGEGEDNRVLILLGDAIVSGCEPGPAMAEISAAHGNASVIGCERVPLEKVSRYGILKVGGQPLSSHPPSSPIPSSPSSPSPFTSALKILDLVEKPSVEEAPSNLAVAGRYLLSCDIFRFLETQTPGKGGEIQLTDAIRRMILENQTTKQPKQSNNCFAYLYPGKRHDIGNPQGYFDTLVAFHGLEGE